MFVIYVAVLKYINIYIKNKKNYTSVYTKLEHIELCTHFLKKCLLRIRASSYWDFHKFIDY